MSDLTDGTCKARPRDEVLREILDPNVAKNEHGWVAADEIERLNERIAELEAENERLVELVCEAFESDDPGSFQEWCDMNGYRLTKGEQANE